MNTLLEKALAAPVTITEAGRTVTIEQRAALFKALVARAIKGDTRSAALVIRLMEQSGLHQEPHQTVTRVERVIISAEPGSQKQSNGQVRHRVGSR